MEASRLENGLFKYRPQWYGQSTNWARPLLTGGGSDFWEMEGVDFVNHKSLQGGQPRRHEAFILVMRNPDDNDGWALLPVMTR